MLPNRRERRKATGPQPDSPETKRLKVLADMTIQKQAFIDLLKLWETNGGIPKYGDYELIKRRYEQKNFACVTVANLRYRVKMMYKHGRRDLFTERDRPSDTYTAFAVTDELSPLTEDNNRNDVPVVIELDKQKLNADVRPDQQMLLVLHMIWQSSKQTQKQQQCTLKKRGLLLNARRYLMAG
jgi:hypothetical protein